MGESAFVISGGVTKFEDRREARDCSHGARDAGTRTLEDEVPRVDCGSVRSATSSSPRSGPAAAKEFGETWIAISNLSYPCGATARDIDDRHVVTDVRVPYAPHQCVHRLRHRGEPDRCAGGVRAVGIGPGHLDVMGLHECPSANALSTYEALGLAGEGECRLMVEKNATTYDGTSVRNLSGGLQRAPAGGHWASAVRRADLAAARQRRGSVSGVGRRRHRLHHRSRWSSRRQLRVSGRAVMGR